MFRLHLLLLAAVLAHAADQVVVIGVDGLSPQGVRGGKVPRLRSLMERGAWTLRARGVMPTVSSPNWASMISGAGPEQHGVTSNEWKRDKRDITNVCKGTEDIFPTMFGLLREQRPSASIAVFHDWDDFSRLVERSAVSVMEHRKGSANTAAAAVDYWKRNQPTLLFLHLDDVDHAGHGEGWHGAAYRKAVEEIDALIGQVIDTVALERTLILVTSDHGGKDKKHGWNSMDDLEIPWIAAGPGVERGREINAPVNTYDTAATVAWSLGLKLHPCWIGRPVYEAFGKVVE